MEPSLANAKDVQLHPNLYKRTMKEFDKIMKEGGHLNVNLNLFLRARFEASSMNVCQTQPLSMMNVPKMTVEFKNESLKTKPKLTTRVIPIPLSLREQPKKDLDGAVKMGILEDIFGK